MAVDNDNIRPAMTGQNTTLVARMIAKLLIKNKIHLLLTLLLVSWGCISDAAASECNEPVAHVVSIQGQVEVRSAGSEQWKAVQPDDKFCPGDRLRVSANSRAGLLGLGEQRRVKNHNRRLFTL